MQNGTYKDNENNVKYFLVHCQDRKRDRDQVNMQTYVSQYSIFNNTLRSGEKHEKGAGKT